MTDEREKLLEMFYHDRYLAHKYIFAHRHKNQSPDFHPEILKAFYSPRQKVLVKSFRGSAKSTLSEEYVLLGCLFRDFKFPILLGNSYERACERLASIKNEIDNNEIIDELFGPQHGSTWSEDEIVMTGGQRIKTFGARQSLRGAKHLEDRPDLAMIDDMEDEENVATEQARYKMKRWFNGSVLPALVPIIGKIRMVGTPLHPKSMVEEKSHDRDWECVTVPICYIDPVTGEEKASWPERFPMTYIDTLRTSYLNDGAMTEFNQEFMCRSEDEASKPFQAPMIKKGQSPGGYLAKFAMVDPARTVGSKSARTGYAVWSWSGNKLFVHESYGAFHKPNEIIDEMFRIENTHAPVFLGVEVDGLEEFIMQPLRSEQVKRGVSLPILPMRAPRDKIGFITSLQPFYQAGDVIHIGEHPDLERELQEFPTGRMDVPNALAYALRMRAGRPVYEDFQNSHIQTDLQINSRHPRYLAVSSRPAMTGAVLVQHIDGVMRVLGSWVYNEPPMEAADKLLPEAKLAAGGEFVAITPEEQMGRYVNNGIPAMFAAKKIKLIKGKPAATSIRSLQTVLTTQRRGQPAFLISPHARLVLNGLAWGYRRAMTTGGTLQDNPEPNQYCLVMEALESFASFISSGTLSADKDLQWSQTAQGRDFISMLPTRK